MSTNALSAVKGKSRAIKLKRLAAAWAREAEEELRLEAGDVAPLLQAVQDALNLELERKPQRQPG
jgi:8-oxo-dGTP pyrophosphatase MutT (NUDIX family)